MSTMGSREAGRCVKETDAAVMGVSMVQGRADTGAGKLAMRRGSPLDLKKMSGEQLGQRLNPL